MANQLSMVKRQDIYRLFELGFSRRAIAGKLNVHRETVSRYIRLGQSQSKPAKVPAGSEGRTSQCQPFRQVIQDKLQAGLSAQRIWQDLQAEHGFCGAYDSVKRFVRRLGQADPVAFRRMECEPGQEAQVDFGTGAPIERPNGRKKRPHVFRIVLSYSRKGYSEVVWHQDTETFIRCLENAFRYFGGVPKTPVIDNLKAAVSRADWYDPELNPKIQSFCEHYGTVILPTKPYTPRHKGKIEAGVKYVQDNALKACSFKSLADENRFLADWEQNVADTRIHGTTKQQVSKRFCEYEQAALLPVSTSNFPFFQEGKRSVHRDGHVEVDKAYYSVPPEYLNRTVWVRYDGRVVRVFDHRFEQIAIHAKADPGRFKTQQAHIASKKISMVERGAEYLLGRIQQIGPHSSQWANTMLQERGIPALRVLQGFIALAEKYPVKEVERTCEIALRHGCFRLRALRRLIKQDDIQADFEFIKTHPIIRDMQEYGGLIKVSFRS